MRKARREFTQRSGVCHQGIASYASREGCPKESFRPSGKAICLVHLSE
jgi:hypothetical protein